MVPRTGTFKELGELMTVSNKKLIDEVIEAFPNIAESLKSWLAIVEQAEWQHSHDVKAQFGQAKIIGGKNIVFKIKGNAYRLWIKVNYATGVVLVKKFGTHKEYDGWEIK